MLSPGLLSSLSELPQPLLTAYLDTNPSEPDNQRSAPGYMAWLKTEAKSVAMDVAASERSSFREQVSRVQRFLHDRTAQQRGLVIFSGLATWQEILLKVKLRNELHWGQPAVSQLVDLVAMRSGSRRTANAHGCRFMALGARMAASMRF